MHRRYDHAATLLSVTVEDLIYIKDVDMKMIVLSSTLSVR